MTEPNLKPCAHCGRKASLIIDQDHHGEWFNLGCSGKIGECNFRDVFYTCSLDELPKAILEWNTRSTDEKYDRLLNLVKTLLKDLSDDDFVFNREEKLYFKDLDDELFKSEFLCILTKIKCENLLKEIGEL